MMRYVTLLAAAALLFVSSAVADVLVSDSVGNASTLPATTTEDDSFKGAVTGPLTSYVLTVFVDTQNTPGESFTLVKTSPPTGPNGWGTGTFVKATYQPINGNEATTSYDQNAPTSSNAQGTYRFYFSNPATAAEMIAQVNYVGAPSTNFPTGFTDTVNIDLTYSSSVVGDPQFVGLRGQSYQVHGIDGAVYNLISSKSTQVNSRFAFLSDGSCPVVNGVAQTSNCWSHPGSYLGEMSFQQKIDGKIHSALLQSGSAKTGFAAVQFDGQELAVGERKSIGSFSVERTSSHHVSITTEEFIFELDNSDHFINQGVAATVPLSQLQSHGLLGQTHMAKVYPTAVRYIAGEVDDYVIADDNLFGTSFVHNQF